MEKTALKQYLARQLQLVQDEEVLLAIKTIVDKHVEHSANPYGAKHIIKDSPPTATAHTPSDEVSSLKNGVEQEEQEQQIADWLKEL